MNSNSEKNIPKKNSNIDLNAPKKIRIIYEKQLPLEDFIEENQKELKQYICHLCTGVLVEPVMDVKGHIFCKKCLLTYEKKHFSKSKKLLCPISNHVLKMSDLKPYELISDYLCKMTCICPNRKKGCKWEGKYNLRNKHIEKECNFIDQEICPNEGCEMILKIENIDAHLLQCDYRKINCEKCGENFLFKNKNEHKKECVKEKIQCQKCGDSFLREEMENHLRDTCLGIEIDCDFLFFGCKDKFTRKNRKQHYISASQIISHNKMIINWFQNFNVKINTNLSQIQNNLRENRIKLNYLKEKFDKLV